MSIEKLKLAAEQIVSRMAAVKSEEATKQAMVMPMIQATASMKASSKPLAEGRINNGCL